MCPLKQWQTRQKYFMILFGCNKKEPSRSTRAKRRIYISRSEKLNLIFGWMEICIFSFCNEKKITLHKDFHYSWPRHRLAVFCLLWLKTAAVAFVQTSTSCEAHMCVHIYWEVDERARAHALNLSTFTNNTHCNVISQIEICSVLNRAERESREQSGAFISSGVKIWIIVHETPMMKMNAKPHNSSSTNNDNKQVAKFTIVNSCVARALKHTHTHTHKQRQIETKRYSFVYYTMMAQLLCTLEKLKVQAMKLMVSPLLSCCCCCFARVTKHSLALPFDITLVCVFIISYETQNVCACVCVCRHIHSIKHYKCARSRAEFIKKSIAWMDKIHLQQKNSIERRGAKKWTNVILCLF